MPAPGAAERRDRRSATRRPGPLCQRDCRKLLLELKTAGQPEAVQIHLRGLARHRGRSGRFEPLPRSRPSANGGPGGPPGYRPPRRPVPTGTPAASPPQSATTRHLRPGAGPSRKRGRKASSPGSSRTPPPGASRSSRSGFEIGPTFARLKLCRRTRPTSTGSATRPRTCSSTFNSPPRPLISSAGRLHQHRRPAAPTARRSRCGRCWPPARRPPRPAGIPRRRGRRGPHPLAQPRRPGDLPPAGRRHHRQRQERIHEPLLAALATAAGPATVHPHRSEAGHVQFPGQTSPYLPKPIANDANDALPLIERCFDEMGSVATRPLKQRHKENVCELTERTRSPASWSSSTSSPT